MGTRTIAVDDRVYERLTASKRAGESFSRAIDRLLSERETAHTGNDILRGLLTVAPLSAADAEVFKRAVDENRGEAWEPRDLR